MTAKLTELLGFRFEVQGDAVKQVGFLAEQGLVERLALRTRAALQGLGRIHAKPFPPAGDNVVELKIFPFALSLSKPVLSVAEGSERKKSNLLRIKPFMLRQAQHERLNSTALPAGEG